MIDDPYYFGYVARYALDWRAIGCYVDVTRSPEGRLFMQGWIRAGWDIWQERLGCKIL